MVDVETGLQPNANTKKIIYEAFKPVDNFVVELEKLSNKDTLVFYDTNSKKEIFQFY